MGAGASSTPSLDAGLLAGEGKDRKQQAKDESREHYLESSPFGDVGGSGVDFGDAGNAGAKRASGVISDARLKKIALGIPTYKEIQRDYSDTLEELELNHSQQVEWVAPPVGFEKRPEKLVDGPIYGRGASPAAPNYPTQDMRAALAGGRGGQSGRAPQVIPGTRPRPPAPRRPSNPIPVPVPVPTPGVGHVHRAQSPSSMQPTEAPSVLPRPKAALESAPLMTVPLQSYSEANPYPGVGSFASASASTSASASASASAFASASASASASAFASASASASASTAYSTSITTPTASSRQAGPSSSSSRVVAGGFVNIPSGTPTLARAERAPPKIDGEEEEELHYSHSDYASHAKGRPAIHFAATPPRNSGPHNMGKIPIPVVSLPSTFSDASEHPPPNLPVRPFLGTEAASDKEYDDGDGANMYATFGAPPLEAGTPDTKRPSFVPALSIGSGGSLAPQPYPVFHPSVPQKPSQPLARPPGSPAPGRAGPDGSGGASGPATRETHVGSPAVVRNTGGKPTQNAPPKPNSKSPHEVKETKDVKRNRAQLPAQLTHAKPTTGDWLKKRYIVNNYILLDILGAGSYGEVRMCKDRTSDHLYAIKIISKDLLKKKKNGNTSETYFEDIKREIAIMKKLLHPNVLRLFEVLDDPNVNKMYLVLEYMKKGDLINILKGREVKPAEGQEKDTRTSAIKSVFTPLSDQELWNIFRQVAAGIRYLHYQNIVHGDIKPQNLLVGEDGVVKIADFGIAKMLHASGQKLADAAGTPAFMAPELFDSGKAFSGQLSDIWAMGATMFMLRFGHPPFVAKSIVKLSDKILNDPLVFPYVIDDLLRDLLENMLLKDPTRRLTLQQVIMHKWMRVPPAASQRPATGTSSGNSSGGATGDNTSTRPLVGIGIGFNPPPSYDNEEAAAMAVPVTADNDDVFMSIGTRSAPLKRAVSTEEGEGDDEENEEFEEGGDVMATQWGADVFEMVDDEVNSDSDDEDAAITGGSPNRKPKDLSKGSLSKILFDTETSVNSQQRGEMTAEEEERRAQRFRTEKLTKRSLQNVIMNGDVNEDGAMDFDSKGDYTSVASAVALYDPPLFRTGPGGRDDVAASSKESGRSSVQGNWEKSESKAETEPSLGNLNTEAVYKGSARDGKYIPGPGPPRGPGRGGPLTVSIPHSDDKAGFNPSASPEGGTPLTTPKSISKRMPRSPGAISGSQQAFDEEETEQLTMEEFEGLMDTLALQPQRDDAEAAGPVNVTLQPSTFSAQLRNYENFVGAAFHSEQGRRDNQEDRCVLLPDVSAMRALESCNPPLSPAVMEQLKRFSIAGVFDGHSGWRCAQYLSQNLVPNLVLHENFLDKQPDTAVLDVFKSMDDQICRLLRKENDSSGSTGVVVIYDGRRHVLTVANVGDSMCVLSRGGRAVKLHRMHRVGVDDTAERKRVENAGGAILNNRVAGVLAISRAFGDTQFKEPGYCPVIAVPDLCSEVITPMTEFGVIATDGLWDVMAPQVVINFVRKKLSKRADLQESARELVQEAMARGSVDNCTVLIISFHLQGEPGSSG